MDEFGQQVEVAERQRAEAEKKIRAATKKIVDAEKEKSDAQQEKIIAEREKEDAEKKMAEAKKKMEELNKRPRRGAAAAEQATLTSAQEKEGYKISTEQAQRDKTNAEDRTKSLACTLLKVQRKLAAQTATTVHIRQMLHQQVRTNALLAALFKIAKSRLRAGIWRLFAARCMLKGNRAKLAALDTNHAAARSTITAYRWKLLYLKLCLQVRQNTIKSVVVAFACRMFLHHKSLKAEQAQDLAQYLEVCKNFDEYAAKVEEEDRSRAEKRKAKTEKGVSASGS
ncbi:hypothetical protein K491DRAFT_713871 [Lophiostoma macrostomum CBS 122681]|uniref:Uncharacterized protein n=1 Tax=Lophiostoma macrostomum CBS 122681 TaxID=1314788 RepID=A0A6A6TFI6_9PLEO|nr:hypothetical protein K491DRAFT_713871 [Lophiostoma macrostomum CBS 122681]